MRKPIEHRPRIALLVDGENAQWSVFPSLMIEAGRYGDLTLRRIYGDWTSTSMAGWKESLHSFAVQPVQQFRYTVGKNATDSSLIIDAMDILHANTVDGFIIVSSDSDFTRLATRIREGGRFVIGIGEFKTPKAFVNACNVFTYTENLRETGKMPETESRDIIEMSPDPSGEDPLPLLLESFDLSVHEDGWADLASFGNYLRQIDPGFDPRSHGHRQLIHLIGSYPEEFEIRHQDGPGPVYLRRKTVDS